MIENRHAKIVHKDGGHHLHVKAHVRAGDFVFPYDAHGDARHEIDHEGILAKLDAKLAHRATLMNGIFGLIGTKGAVDGIAFEITEANLRVHSPAKFESFVKWVEKHGAEDVEKSRSRTFSDPAECEGPPQLRAAVEAEIGTTAAMLKRAERKVAAFVANGSIKP